MLEDGEYYVKVDGQDVAANRIVRAQPSPYTINFYDDPNSEDDNLFAVFAIPDIVASRALLLLDSM
jgi:hypothetical protein